LGAGNGTAPDGVGEATGVGRTTGAELGDLLSLREIELFEFQHEPPNWFWSSTQVAPGLSFPRKGRIVVLMPKSRSIVSPPIPPVPLKKPAAVIKPIPTIKPTGRRKR
jgi:hypothetical protein